jgi:hypothetical protein
MPRHVKKFEMSHTCTGYLLLEYMFSVVTVRNQRADLDETQKSEPPDDQNAAAAHAAAAARRRPGGPYTCNAKYAKLPKATTDLTGSASESRTR